MVLWYVGLSVLGVAAVFRSSGIDYRLVAIGSLLPLVVDIPFGHRAYGHTLLLAVGLLLLVMVATVGKPRLLRRRWLCVPIGVLCGLVLSGAFTQDHLFWWPVLGTSYPHHGLFPAWWAVLFEELAGLVVAWGLVGRYDLYLRDPLHEFFRTGRLT